MPKAMMVLALASALAAAASASQDLITAASDGDATKVQELLQNGADVEFKDLGSECKPVMLQQGPCTSFYPVSLSNAM